MGGLFGQVMGLTVIFTPWLLLAIFLIVLVAEFGVSIPYLMESVWLFSGYNLAIGNISIQHLLLFCVIGLVGRIAGASALFYISWYSKTPLGILFLGYLKPRVAKIAGHFHPLQIAIDFLKRVVHRITLRNSKSKSNRVCDSKTLNLFGRDFKLSPFTIVLGRFLWLRMPITIALGMRNQRRSLFLGVAIFSIVWDAAYLAFGVLGGKGGLEPIQMLLYPLGTMILISALVFGFQRLRAILVST